MKKFLLIITFILCMFCTPVLAQSSGVATFFIYDEYHNTLSDVTVYIYKSNAQAEQGTLFAKVTISHGGQQVLPGGFYVCKAVKAGYEQTFPVTQTKLYVTQGAGYCTIDMRTASAPPEPQLMPIVIYPYDSSNDNPLTGVSVTAYKYSTGAYVDSQIVNYGTSWYLPIDMYYFSASKSGYTQKYSPQDTRAQNVDSGVAYFGSVDIPMEPPVIVGNKVTFKPYDYANNNPINDIRIKVYEADLSGQDIQPGDLVVNGIFSYGDTINIASGLYLVEGILEGYEQVVPVKDCRFTASADYPSEASIAMREIIPIEPGIFQVKTYDDLCKIGTNVDGWSLDSEYIQMNDITCPVGSNFIPIGNGDLFEGSYDGKGYKINNLVIDNNFVYTGLFYGINNSAILTDIHLNNANITSTSTSIYGCIGGIVGFVLEGEITDCSVLGVLNSNSIDAGGIVGRAPTVMNCVITNCIANIDFYNNGGNIGGITAEIHKGNIYNCEYSGNIFTYGNVGYGNIGGITSLAYEDVIIYNSKVTNLNIIGDSGYIGGLIGQCYGTNIDKCNVKINMDVNANIASGFIGFFGGGYVKNSNSVVNINCSSGGSGFIHEMYGGYIDNCHSTGFIISQGDNARASGGFIGGMFPNAEYIINCSSSVDVTVLQYVQYRECGGFIGSQSSGLIKNCYSTGNINASMEYVGGFAGNSVSNSNIEECYATGNVNGRDSNFVGGFYGTKYGGNTKNCYSTGNIEVSNVNNDNIGIGGFCGETVTDLENCYCNGLVTAIGYTSTQLEKVGAFLGSSPSTIDISSCYFDIDKSGITTTAGNAQEKTTAQMQNINTYTGWNIAKMDQHTNEIWYIPDYGYPRLSFQSAPLYPGIVYFRDYNSAMPIDGVTLRIYQTDPEREVGDLVFNSVLNDGDTIYLEEGYYFAEIAKTGYYSTNVFTDNRIVITPSYSSIPYLYLTSSDAPMPGEEHALTIYVRNYKTDAPIYGARLRIYETDVELQTGKLVLNRLIDDGDVIFLKKGYYYAEISKPGYRAVHAITDNRVVVQPPHISAPYLMLEAFDEYIPPEDTNFIDRAGKGFADLFGVTNEIGKTLLGLFIAFGVGTVISRELRGGALEFAAGSLAGLAITSVIGLTPIWIFVVFLLLAGLLIGWRYFNSSSGGGY